MRLSVGARDTLMCAGFPEKCFFHKGEGLWVGINGIVALAGAAGIPTQSGTPQPIEQVLQKLNTSAQSHVLKGVLEHLFPCVTGECIGHEFLHF